MAAPAHSTSPLVFIHVPKAAGSALRLALVDALDAQRPHSCFDGTHMGSFEPREITHPPMRGRLMTGPEDYPAAADFVAGHVSPAFTRVAYPDAPHMTVLRESRSRILSMWLYSRMFSNRQLRRWGAASALFTSARGSLAGYLADPVAAPHTDNTTVRQLVWPHPLVPDTGFLRPQDDDALLAAARESLRDMGFVGTVEEPALAERLGTWLGTPVVMDRFEHPGVIAPGARPDVVAEAAAAGDLLAERSRLDQRLWREVVTGLVDADEQEGLADRTFERTVARHQRALAAAPDRPLRVRVADRAWDLVRG